MACVNWKADSIVKTKDGRSHRVLWPVKPDKLRVKGHGKTSRRTRDAYTINIKDIVP